METDPQAQSAAPKASPAVPFLEKYLELARKGEIQAVMLGYVQLNGGAAVQSTPMSPIMLNHLSTLLERRVAREYDRALAKSSDAVSPTGPMRANSPKSELPRKVRRQVEIAQRKEAARLAKKAKQQANGAALIRRPPTSG